MGISEMALEFSGTQWDFFMVEWDFIVIQWDILGLQNRNTLFKGIN